VETPPVIDGDLSDIQWEQVEWGGSFTQREPFEGEAPTQQTQFKILYDDNTFYIAYRCFDSDPDQIVSRMSRRDGFAGDWVEINIDSRHDKRTGFSFTASVSGVKGDEYITEDGNNWDINWDPVWHLKTQIDSLGWTAEIAIPLSQLRFTNAEEQVWGIQFTRRDFRNESRSTWQFYPRNAGYWVSGFGELRGIRGITPKRQVEIQPYVLGELATFQKEPGNPFADGSDFSFSAGVDGKVGITNDLSLDFTVNPDFGQVEADPSVLTLDGYQVFFSERRPFFIQNRDLFNFNISSSDAGGSYDSDNLFYSRRIGARPHHVASAQQGGETFIDQPEFTSILGAAKFSGKTKRGTSIGIMEAVTAEEKADIRIDGESRTEVVEPLTNYLVGTVKQDFAEGRTVIGGIFTILNRDINDPQLDFLHETAQTGGLDFSHRWNDRKWRMDARFVMSRVAGTAAAIRRTQTSFEHRFNRPDADHLDYDPEATELVGQGGNVSIAKYGSDFKFQTGVTWRSPKLDLNDIGFMLSADEINHYYWMGYHEQDPFSVFRAFRVNYNHWSRWDFGGQNLYRAVNMNVQGDFKNFWNAGTGLTYENLDLSSTWLRGGPVYRRSAGFGYWFSVNSDSRKAVSANLEINGGGGVDYLVHGTTISLLVGIQPSDALNLSLGPTWSNFERIDQYVNTAILNETTRYIVGHIDQRTLSLTTRINLNITPDLTVQYYGQPFISRGKYKVFKYVIDPLGKDKDTALHQFNDSQISSDGDTYFIDEDADGTNEYSFGNPDFNFVQFRSNLVVRWEYTPGSEVFVVWTQGNTVFNQQDQRSLFDSLSGNLFSESSRNTFLIKMTYRFLNK
jgi:hypothetical protein